MLSAQEFFNKYNGCKVRATKEYIKERPYFVCWVGRIIPPENSSCIYTETLIEDSMNFNIVGSQRFWSPGNLEVIDEVDINFPTNKHICPKCKQEDCNGFQQIECISGVI